MPVNIQDKELTLCKKGIKRKVNVWVEQDILVPDTKPDVMQIISTQATPYILNCEVSNSKIKVSGKINYFIIYKVSDEKYKARGLFVTYPFTETLNVDGVENGANVVIKPVINNVITSLPNERKIAIKSEIIFDICIRDYTKVKLINNFNSEKEIEKQLVNGTFSNIINNKRSIIASKEDLLLEKEATDLLEILRVESSIINTETKESFNKIMVKGDILLKLMYLSENEEEGIRNTNLEVPFTGMVEFDSISEKSKFAIEYILEDLEVSLNKEITSTKAISVEYRIGADITQYEEEEVSYVDDFYSQYEELEYEEKKYDVIKDINRISYEIEVKENIGKISEQTKIIDYRTDLSNVNAIASISNGIKVNGNIKIDLLMQDTQTREIESKNIELLVDKEFRKDDIDLTRNNEIAISLKDVKISQNESSIDVNLILNLDIDSRLEGQIRVIDNLTTNKIDMTNLDSMNIYIVKENDDLWNIAKKYKTSVENLEKINEEVRNNNISVGQKILIIR